MSHDQEHWKKYQEALQRASQQGALNPEQMQMIQAAFQKMQEGGAGQQAYVVTRNPDGTVVQQGTPPAWHPGGKAPPTTIMPGQQPPAAMPQGYIDPLYRNALTELQRWAGQYEKYRMQGSFAQLEPIFQAIKQITGH